jgi:hypothetical protein
MLLSYRTTYKITIEYTPYQLVYGLHPLIPIEYIVLVVVGDERHSTPVRVLTNRIIELEKLKEAKI